MPSSRLAFFAFVPLLVACASPEAPPQRPVEDSVVSFDTVGVAAVEPKGPETWTAGVTDVRNDEAVPERLVDVRAAAHDGFDRIVFAFSGADVPGYHVEYVDQPVRACGSGETVPLVGDGFLEIRLYPTAAHDEAGNVTVAAREQVPDLPVLRELKLTCDFEAEVAWAAGLAAPNPYRAFVLRDPARLVVDVQH